MGEHTVVRFRNPETVHDALTELLRDGAQRLLRQAVEAELQEFLAVHADRHDEQGRSAVVRNGHLPEREVLTGIGPVSVQVPKVRRRTEESAVFRSSLVPPVRAQGEERGSGAAVVVLARGGHRADAGKRSRCCWARRRQGFPDRW